MTGTRLGYSAVGATGDRHRIMKNSRWRLGQTMENAPGSQRVNMLTFEVDYLFTQSVNPSQIFRICLVVFELHIK